MIKRFFIAAIAVAMMGTALTLSDSIAEAHNIGDEGCTPGYFKNHTDNHTAQKNCPQHARSERSTSQDLPHANCTRSHQAEHQRNQVGVSPPRPGSVHDQDQQREGAHQTSMVRTAEPRDDRKPITASGTTTAKTTSRYGRKSLATSDQLASNIVTPRYRPPSTILSTSSQDLGIDSR